METIINNSDFFIVILEKSVGIFAFVVMTYIFLKREKSSQVERDAFREDIRMGRKETNAVLRDLTEVIRDINKNNNKKDAENIKAVINEICYSEHK